MHPIRSSSIPIHSESSSFNGIKMRSKIEQHAHQMFKSYSPASSPNWEKYDLFTHQAAKVLATNLLSDYRDESKCEEALKIAVEKAHTFLQDKEYALTYATPRLHFFEGELNPLPHENWIKSSVAPLFNSLSCQSIESYEENELNIQHWVFVEEIAYRPSHLHDQLDAIVNVLKAQTASRDQVITLSLVIPFTTDMIQREFVTMIENVQEDHKLAVEMQLFVGHTISSTEMHAQIERFQQEETSSASINKLEFDRLVLTYFMEELKDLYIRKFKF